MLRALVIVIAALAAALSSAAGARPAADAGFGTAQIRATFAVAWQFGPFCSPGTPAGVECVRFVGTANVPGLGKAMSTYVKLFDPTGCPPETPVRQFARAVIEVAGKGTLELTLNEAACGPPAPAEIGPFDLVVTGGTGVYAGASGSVRFTSSVHEPRARCGTDLCGSASDTWTGALSVPGLEFDLTAPALRGVASRTLRAPKRAKRARLRYTVTAQDAVDGPVPVACRPRSGGFVKIGRTRVTCAATDSSANRSVARFVVTVRRASR
jgi:hypothetical protein